MVESDILWALLVEAVDVNPKMWASVESVNHPKMGVRQMATSGRKSAPPFDIVMHGMRGEYGVRSWKKIP